MKLNNIKFKDNNQPMTTLIKAGIVFMSMSSATRLSNQLEGSKLPEDQKPFFGSVGALIFNKRTNEISNTCLTINGDSWERNEFAISMDDVPLTNELLQSLIDVRPELAATFVKNEKDEIYNVEKFQLDETKSPYENFTSMLVREVANIKDEENEFLQEKSKVGFIKKKFSKFVNGHEPFENDKTILFQIEEKSGLLYSDMSSILNKDVQNFADILGDFAYDIRKDKDPMDIIMSDVVEETTSSSQMNDSPLELGD